jgi:hypothetical protein
MGSIAVPSIPQHRTQVAIDSRHAGEVAAARVADAFDDAKGSEQHAASALRLAQQTRCADRR